MHTLKLFLLINSVWALLFLLTAAVLTRRTYALVMPPPTRDYRVRVVEAVLLGEARGEGPGGIERVAEVIRNRMTTPGFPSTAVAVVEAPYQFSCLNNITPEILLEQREGWVIPHVTAGMAQWCATQLVFPHGFEFGNTNLTSGATHYHTAGIQPKWARGLKPVATYKNHIFYK